MIQNYTLHTHTFGFDGQNSAQDMALRAKELGFKTIGFSNHFIVHPNIKRAKMYEYSVRGRYNNIYASDFPEVIARFHAHYEELEKLKSDIYGIKILRGMEVDFFDNSWWRDNFEKVLNELKPDYVIGSTHFIESKGALLNTHDWSVASNQDELLKTYWENVARAGASGLFTWMAHLDLPKKVFLGLEDKWYESEDNAIKSIAQAHGAIEINTSGYRPYCYEPYPSKRILKMASERGVPVIISDDAHSKENIGRHFDEASELISKFNLKQLER